MRGIHVRPETLSRVALLLVIAVASVSTVVQVTGQTVRGARARGTVVQGEHGTAAVGPRGAAVKGDEGYAAVGRRGAVVHGDDGTAAVGRRGAVVVGEEGHGAAVGRYGGVVVGNHYEDYEGWRVAAGVAAGTAIAVGTMLSRPPAGAATVVVGPTSYLYSGGSYYTRVVTGGAVAYQVVAPPAGAIIATLPAGCAAARVGAVTYQRCGNSYYERVATGYRVVVF